jgi:voltage-gated potassium channel
MRFLLERRAQSAALTATLASIIVVALASITILNVEQAAGEQANIHSAEDALWWSMVTITTVGYGDHYPVTTEGRMVAALLMAIGVGLIGTWSGIAAAWFLSPSEDQQEDDLQKLREELRELRTLIDERLPVSERRNS